MKPNKVRNTILLLIASFIWGTTFVAQSKGGDALGPITFNTVRSFIGCMVLIPVILIMDRVRDHKERTALGEYSQSDVATECIQVPDSGAMANTKQGSRKQLILGGIICGTVLFVASILQQVGIYLGTPVGKAGFLTACYIVLVPIFGMLFKRKCGLNIWIGVLIAVAGLYFLCIKGELTLQLSDLLCICCAVVFSFQILAIDHYSPLVDGVRLSFVQFLTSGVLGILPSIFVEARVDWGLWLGAFASAEAWYSLLYAGVLSSGVAYTFQILGQEGLNPTVASLVMSLESVFSVIAGAIVLKEYLSTRELLGCALVFAAVVLAQIPLDKHSRGKKEVK